MKTPSKLPIRQRNTGASATVRMPAARHRRITGLITALYLVAVTAAVQATTAREHLDAFYSGIKTMQAGFIQTRFDESGKPLQTSEGVFALQRPGKFRFEYTKPYKQLYVADGGKIWNYDPDLEQVIVKSINSAVGDTPALLLSGKRPLENDFIIRQLKRSSSDLQWLELQPKQEQSSFQSVRLGFSSKGLRLMEVVDILGQTTRLQFRDVKVNTRLPAKLFSFTAPQGVDVIDGQ